MNLSVEVSRNLHTAWFSIEQGGKDESALVLCGVGRYRRVSWSVPRLHGVRLLGSFDVVDAVAARYAEHDVTVLF